MSLSFKFRQDPSFRWGDIPLFVTVYDLELKILSFSIPSKNAILSGKKRTLRFIFFIFFLMIILRNLLSDKQNIGLKIRHLLASHKCLKRKNYYSLGENFFLRLLVLQVTWWTIVDDLLPSNYSIQGGWDGVIIITGQVFYWFILLLVLLCNISL